MVLRVYGQAMEQTNIKQDLSAAELNALLEAKAVTLVDVREPGEHAAERIEGAVLHPLSTFDPHALPAGKLVFQCGIGRRSLDALRRSAAAGLPAAQHLEGGLAAWKQAGLPTRRG
jgi:rhodanese-related sulfurtransferase